MGKRFFLYRVKSKGRNASVCIAANSAVVIKANSAEASLPFAERAGVRTEGTGLRILSSTIVKSGIHGEPLRIALV